MQGKKVGLWVRVSSDMQVKDESPEVHLKRAQDYCADRGFEAVEVYRLDGVSGGAIWDLPIAQKMRYDIETGRINGLVFTALDRLGRDTLELLRFEHFFREHGACLISIFDNIDTSTSDGKRYFQMLASQAEYERAKLSERVRRGIITRQKRGEQFAAAPYGYTKEKKRLVIHPQERPVVEMVFSLFLSGKSLSNVAKELNAKGFRTRAGKPFSYMRVKAILSCSTVMGEHWANRSEGKYGKLKPRDAWIKIDVDPIVSKETFDMANLHLKKLYRPQKRTKHAYSGLLHCHCGAKMYHRSRNDNIERPRYFCRACTNKIKDKDLDQAIGSIINSFALDRLPANAQFEFSTEHEQKQRLLSAMSANLQDQVRKKDKLIELFTEDAISLSEFKTRREVIDQRIAEIEQEKSSLEYDLALLKGQEASEQVIKKALKELPWHELSEAHKNEILKTFVREITLTPETIELQLLYVPATLNCKNV